MTGYHRSVWWWMSVTCGALAIAVAHQAALAVEETRYHQAMLHAERLAAIGQTIAADTLGETPRLESTARQTR